MNSKINQNYEFPKIKNHRKRYLLLTKSNELNKKKKALEEDNFQRLASIIFMKNKFQFPNDFDHDGTKDFLKEKLKYLKPMNLDDSLIEIKNHRKSKHNNKTTSKKKIRKYKSTFFYSDVPKIPIKNSTSTINQLFSSNSLCLNDLLNNFI